MNGCKTASPMFVAVYMEALLVPGCDEKCLLKCFCLVNNLWPLGWGGCVVLRLVSLLPACWRTHQEPGCRVTKKMDPPPPIFLIPPGFQILRDRACIRLEIGT